MSAGRSALCLILLVEERLRVRSCVLPRSWWVPVILPRETLTWLLRGHYTFGILAFKEVLHG